MERIKNKNFIKNEIYTPHPDCIDSQNNNINEYKWKISIKNLEIYPSTKIANARLFILFLTLQKLNVVVSRPITGKLVCGLNFETLSFTNDVEIWTATRLLRFSETLFPHQLNDKTEIHHHTEEVIIDGRRRSSKWRRRRERNRKSRWGTWWRWKGVPTYLRVSELTGRSDLLLYDGGKNIFI